ncbi:hypothetical protein JCM30471_07630 [Desulfuromonas carbonis]|uniref:OmpA family protein n=1 Tax=Desulfuromonas sp. DDH964 TaxID=1823759 RepID=UPI00078E76EA|nr:OmpA family protein [Desulfuromonas sp. DDH964]AMV72277.1 hypothetical protein DBW_1924 [Desulfuromonas sp. DDH964]
MKVWLTALMLLICYSEATASGEGLTEDRLKHFFTSQTVIASIKFSPGSFKLDAAAKEALDLVFSNLQDLDLKQKVIRAEGLPGGGISNGKNLDLNIRRVKAVEDYLRTRHKLKIERYMVGFGSADSKDARLEENQVDIVLYDNIWDLEQVGVETVTKLQK